MKEKSGYKEQHKLSFGQFLSELPNFIAVLVSVIVSKSLITIVDLLDSLSNLLRTAMVTLLSKKLSKDLRYQYNYGIGKIEAIASLLCEGVIFFGLLLVVGFSVYEVLNPSKPSDLLIAVVGLKVVNVSFDVIFYVKQRQILKQHSSSISKSNCAAAFGALLFDSVTLFSLLIIWILRNNVISGYITPIISVGIAIYLMIGCFKRTKVALDELTDKTLPEDVQLKILKIMTQFYQRYSEFHSVKSHRSGTIINVDVYLSFEGDTSFDEIISLKHDMQKRISEEIDNCTINLIVQENK